MSQPTDEKASVDHVPRASDAEKGSMSHELDPKSKLALFEDPDEGLSPEERAKIVRSL
jgi:hypothetical protein